jgi:hypothetical protein
MAEPHPDDRGHGLVASVKKPETLIECRATIAHFIRLLIECRHALLAPGKVNVLWLANRIEEAIEPWRVK